MIDWNTEFYLNIGNTDNKNGKHRVTAIFCRSGNRQYSCIVLKYSLCASGYKTRIQAMFAGLCLIS